MKRSAILLLLASCTVFDHQLAPVGDCTTNAECTERLSTTTTPTPAICVQQPLGHCVQLTSDDCQTVTGDYTDDRAVLIASLLSVTGAQASSNVPRQQSAIMAVEEINAVNASGGILESASPGDNRKLVMVSCDEAANLSRTANHLITDLRVSAIVGPNLSQDTLSLTTGDATLGLPSSAQAGTAMLTPVAQASAIATVPDNGLTFMMTASDVQRAPLTKIQINSMESDLKTARSKTTIKFGIYYRNDALGQGTRDGLATLMLNGAPLATEISLGKAREDAYDPTSTDNTALVMSYAQFQPDIIVVVGTAEVVKYFMLPLEAAWPTAVPRPYYIATDASKVADLLTAVTGNDDLRTRIRGTGITTNAESLPVLSAFQIAYGQRWRDTSGNPQPATQSGMGSTYDSVYAIALALVGSTDIRGAGISTGLAKLAGNTQACAYDASGVTAPCFTVSDHARTLYNNMGALLQNKSVTEIGTSGRFEWDSQGGKANGLIEMWCINATGPKPIFASSGLTYDIKTQTSAGTYVPCAP